MNEMSYQDMTVSLLNVRASPRIPTSSSLSHHILLRGGNQDEEIIDLDDLSEESLLKISSRKQQEPITAILSHSEPTKSLHKALIPSTVFSSFRTLANMYAVALLSRPILTKSFTAGFIFALSDYTAQKLNPDALPINWTRTLSSGLVGLLYFGPAAHAWYQTIFQILPGTSLVSTLQKAALGQLIFGPSFTCVFFAVSLLQARSFSLNNWIAKIQTDLPKAWIAGLGFWPLVDLFSYSIVPKEWIPLFVNFCSFIWTIYLSIVANQKK